VPYSIVQRGVENANAWTEGKVVYSEVQPCMVGVCVGGKGIGEDGRVIQIPKALVVT